MKVWPRDEQIAKLIKHPGTGVGFNPDDLSKGSTWPDDAFTFRRLGDGTVLSEPPKLQAKASPSTPSKEKQNAN